ncbi:hypothetical protein KCU95_g3530, partial [Aureobasidium melanogenum]
MRREKSLREFEYDVEKDFEVDGTPASWAGTDQEPAHRYWGDEHHKIELPYQDDHQGRLATSALTPDKKFIAASNGFVVSVVDIATKQCRMEFRASIPKKIIICCDGTWQSAVSGEENNPSNVTRLARSLNRVAKQDGKVWQQVVWYDSGIGTTSGWLGKNLEGAIGAGIEGNIIEAYNFVVLNWTPGGQVLCFGFSRGAYTARSIAGLISDIGICKPGRLQDSHEIWEAYKSNNQRQRFQGSDVYYDYMDGILAADEDQPNEPGDGNSGQKWKTQPRGDWAISPESREIEVVGVYDTVGALGFPEVFGYRMQWDHNKHNYHNVKLNPNIKNAFQALALDERRKAFSPTLWHLPEAPPKKDGEPDQSIEEKLAEKRMLVDKAAAAWNLKKLDKKVPLADRQKLKSAYNEARRELCRTQEYSKKPSRLRQVWFPGVHINIGGGSSDSLEDQGDLEEMANITFSWMLDQISSHVSINDDVVKEDAEVRQEHINELNEEVRKYNIKVAQDQKEAAERTWAQWASHTLASAASTVMHPLTRPKESHTESYDMGWGTGKIIDSYTRMYHANGPRLRTPGKPDTSDKPDTSANAVDYDMPGSTNEEIHPTVGYRCKMFKKLAKSKNPSQKLDENDPLVYRPAGFPNGVELREHKIKPRGFERLAMAHADSMWRDADDIQNGVDVKNEIPLSDEGSGDEDWDLVP